jgi:hypothetical protein
MQRQQTAEEPAPQTKPANAA